MTNQPDNFREDLLALLFQLRMTQLMIDTFRGRDDAENGDEHRVLTRTCKEIYQKIEWYISLSLKITADNRLSDELRRRDDKIYSIKTAVDLLVDQIASEEANLEDPLEMLLSKSRHREWFKKAWETGRAGLTTFDEWYANALPGLQPKPSQQSNTYV